MKKLEAKKTNNKGFSLVELIIVIAIMAVLMVVLAPQLLRYVESSRLQRDNSAISEIANAIKVALSDEDIADDIPSGGLTITASSGANTNQTFKLNDMSCFSVATATDLQAELNEILGDEVATSSRTYREVASSITITIGADYTITATNMAEEVDTVTTAVVNF